MTGAVGRRWLLVRQESLLSADEGPGFRLVLPLAVCRPDAKGGRVYESWPLKNDERPGRSLGSRYIYVCLDRDTERNSEQTGYKPRA